MVSGRVVCVFGWDMRGPAYSFAFCASEAVALPFVRVAFWSVRYSRSSLGTPRMV